MNNAVAIREETQLLAKNAEVIVDLMRGVLKQGIHYGVTPNCGSKPSLYKAGAEKLVVAFHFRPEIVSENVFDPSGHLTVIAECKMYHGLSDTYLGNASGICSTRETKYAKRKSGLVCPQCGKETIIVGKKEFGGGYICFTKKGGCGAKFATNDAAIADQPVGEADTNPADYYNTVIKMAHKRALVAGVLVTTAASDVFTQDAGIYEGYPASASAVPPDAVLPEVAEDVADRLERCGGDLEKMLKAFAITDLYCMTPAMVARANEVISKRKAGK
jgi:hypothetical protein